MPARRLQSKIQRAIIAVLVVTLMGVIGYMSCEGCSLLDALYMTVITLSTVGYREVVPLTTSGKIFTIFLIIGGFGIVLYTVGQLAVAIIEGEIIDFLKGRRMDRKLEQVTGHVLICGYGRTGRAAALELQRGGYSVVVVEHDAERVKTAETDGMLVVTGDALEDDVLCQARIEHARSILGALTDDADNVFLTITARGLAPKIQIVARATDEGNEAKLRRAGADRVIAMGQLGGLRMAFLVEQPAVIDFLDCIVHNEHLDLRLEQMRPEEGSAIVGKTLRDSGIRQRSGAMVIGIRRADGSHEINPRANHRLVADEDLIVLGLAEQLDRMRKLLEERGASSE